MNSSRDRSPASTCVTGISEYMPANAPAKSGRCVSVHDYASYAVTPENLPQPFDGPAQSVWLIHRTIRPIARISIDARTHPLFAVLAGMQHLMTNPTVSKCLRERIVLDDFWSRSLNYNNSHKSSPSSLSGQNGVRETICDALVSFLPKPIFYSKCRKSGCLTREAIARK